ncbi:MAG: hypothetical protein ACR2MO_12715, partial [Acidimicrobiales bacterium]
ATGAVTLVSHTPASATTTANASSFSPSITADGAFVAFESYATNLVAGQIDANVVEDVFLFQRATGAVTLVSHTPASATTTGTAYSSSPSISADGAFVTFHSSATNLVAGQSGANGAEDVFLFPRATGAVTLVSHTPASATTTANASSFSPSITADGAFVAFHSSATNLVAGQSDANNDTDLFLFERATGAVTLVSHIPASATTTANAYSFSPSISGDGAFVAFTSAASNLVGGQSDANGAGDVFLFRRTATVAPAAPPADFDGDGDTDVSVYRPSNGTWFVQGGAATVWGASGDIAVPGDYNGDGVVDIAVYRPSTGTWFVNGGAATVWGAGGDIPVPGDYDGDGDADISVYRPSTGTWFVQGGAVTVWGASGDIPVPGDYDGNANVDIAVYRPSTGTWYVNGGATTVWGAGGDIPVPGNYVGGAAADLAVYRPSTGTWFVQGGAATVWGASGDIPVPGDYNADAITDVAVYRPSTGTWFVQGGAVTVWGASGDVPLPLPYAIHQPFFP